MGFLDPEASSNQMLIPQTAPHKRGQVSLRRRPHVHLCKPHGSLDWYEVAGRPIRSDVPLRGRRLIVAPGDTKYRAGYEKPFDAHRERANHAIDRAASLIVVGYGFNDDHLQTHLKPKVAGGTPTVIVARTLSAKAREYLALSDAAVGIEHTTTPASGTTFYRGSDTLFLPARSLWELTSLAKEVLAV